MHDTQSGQPLQLLATYLFFSLARPDSSTGLTCIVVLFRLQFQIPPLFAMIRLISNKWDDDQDEYYFGIATIMVPLMNN